MDDSLFSAFNKAVARSRGGGMAKVLRSPLHLPWSKLMEVLARRMRTVFRKRANTFWGGKMLVLVPEPVSMTIYRYGFFEEELTGTVMAKLKPGMVFFDIGAHFGYFSLLAAHLVGSSGSVHAFEPTPSTFAVLKENTADKPNIKINNLALWSQATNIAFLDYGVEWSAFNSVGESQVHNNMVSPGIEPTRCNVVATTLDDYVQQTGARPGFIKIDAEGAETMILQGGSRALRECRPMITLEVGDQEGETSSKSRALIEFAIGLGYTPFEHVDGRTVPHQLRDRYAYGNMLLQQQ